MSEEMSNATEMNQPKKNAFMAWIDARLPVTQAIEKHMTKYYAPKNFNSGMDLAYFPYLY